jgi:hypothetical protein
MPSYGAGVTSDRPRMMRCIKGRPVWRDRAIATFGLSFGGIAILTAKPRL